MSDSMQQIRVLEVGGSPAVGLAARIFRDVGADVVKVEPAADAIAARQDLDSVTFEYLNTGKKSVALNLETERGVTALRRLLEAVDLVLFDETAGDEAHAMVEEVKQRRPLVAVSLTPFGRSGPYAGYAGVPASTFAAAGESSMLPGGAGYDMFSERPPLVAAGNVAEYDSGITGVLCAAAALIRARGGDERTGVSIDISKQEAEASLNRWLMSHFSASEWIESRATRAYSYGGLTECADGYVMFQGTTTGHWQALIRMIGNPEWAQREEWLDPDYRRRNGAEISSHVRPWAKARTKRELLELALEYGNPVGPFWNAREIHESAHYNERGFFVDYYRDGPEAPPVRWPRLPFIISDTPLTPLAPPPELGADTVEVLISAGFSPEEIAGMVTEGAILTPGS